MTNSPAQPSATPILDLLEPLPKPYDERITGRFAAPFLAAVGLIVMTENYTLLMIPIGIALIGFLSTLVHELGHLFAGWSVGLRFDGVAIGPFVFKRSRAGWVFRLTANLRRGFTFMSVKRICRIHQRLLVLDAGGPCASLMCGLVALIGGELARPHYDSPWPTFFEFFGVYSLFIGVLSFFPFRAGQYAGDGMLLRALVRSKEGATQLIASYALSALRNTPPEGVNWNRRWLQVAYGQPGLVTQYHVDWYAYSMARDHTSAAQFLDRCLVGSAFLEREDRDSLIAETVKFTAWDQNDPVKAQGWLAHLRHPERLDRLSRIRMEVALKSAAGDFDEALEQWVQGLKLVQQSRPGVTTREYEAYWRTWKVEIEKRSSGKLEQAEAVC